MKDNSVGPFIIGVAGGTGSGKTTLSNALLKRYLPRSACLIEQDSYYLDRSQLSIQERAGINYDEPQAIENDLLFQHLSALSEGRSIQKPLYCFESHSRKIETEVVRSAYVLLIEGLFALWDPRIRALMDFRIYVEADSDLRFIRRCTRDVCERGRTMESVVDQYLNSVRPMHYRYIEPTKAFADLVVQNNGAESQFITVAEEAIAQVLQKGAGTRSTA
jgi:uridine kinase